jgi:hypothetical protein
MRRTAMNNPYSVSYIYDETGSAAARYHELLRATEECRLATDPRGKNQGPFSRILSSIVGAPINRNGKLRVRRRTDVKVPTFND